MRTDFISTEEGERKCLFGVVGQKNVFSFCSFVFFFWSHLQNVEVPNRGESICVIILTFSSMFVLFPFLDLVASSRNQWTSGLTSQPLTNTYTQTHTPGSEKDKIYLYFGNIHFIGPRLLSPVRALWDQMLYEFLDAVLCLHIYHGPRVHVLWASRQKLTCWYNFSGPVP